MSSTGLNSSPADEGTGKYPEIKALLARIDDALGAPSTTVEEIGELLGQLGDRLVKQFAFEEDGGYFAEALLHAPRLISKANALMAQHPKMCHLATSLASVLRSGGSTADWRARTADLFQALRNELLRHEKQENLLLQDAYQRDIGIND